MGYLNQARARVILACAFATSVLLVAFPQVDLFVSGYFYAGSFPFADSSLHQAIRDTTTAFLFVSLLGAAIVYLFNRLSGRNLWRVDGRRLCYLLAVLVIGAGLIVNGAFKNQFGRARPNQVAEFGGTRVFTPAFVHSNECRKNCSFSSGEAAAGFFSIALVYAFARRNRKALVLSVVFGGVVSLARIASGAHFLSDTIVSFFVMLLAADALHYYLRLEPGMEGQLYEPDQRGAHQVVRQEMGAARLLANRESDAH